MPFRSLLFASQPAHAAGVAGSANGLSYSCDIAAWAGVALGAVAAVTW